MAEQLSLLPPAELIVEQQSITMSTIALGNQPCHNVDTRFGITNTDTGYIRQLIANVYRIDDARTRGYIPSKVWHTDTDDEIHFLYYTSPTLPSAARPFGDKPCYAFTRSIQSNELIDYPIDARVLVDQVLIRGNMHYLFLFADDQMKHILATDWYGAPWPIDVPEAKIYNTNSCDNT